MNRQLASVLCVALLATLPSCRKKSRAEKKQEEVNTMIELDNSIEEEKNEVKKSVIKF